MMVMYMSLPTNCLYLLGSASNLLLASASLWLASIGKSIGSIQVGRTPQQSPRYSSFDIGIYLLGFLLLQNPGNTLEDQIFNMKATVQIFVKLNTSYKTVSCKHQIIHINYECDVDIAIPISK